jgi:putative tributyrin esterase
MAFATVNFHSYSLRGGSALNVLLPSDDPPLRRPWATLYLLHGGTEDHTHWMRSSSIERYVRGWPLAVVMPAGGNGWYTNAVGGGERHEDHLLKDVIGFVERTFPVRAERAGRAIGGVSMGGYGAVKVGLKHHDRFASVHSHSGPLALLHRPKGIKPEPLPPDLRRVFGDGAVNGPEDPFAIVTKLDHGRLPALRIDCGTGDELLNENRAFHKHLEGMRIAHEYKETAGGHVWGYWDQQVREAIAFHVKHLKLKFDDREK